MERISECLKGVYGTSEPAGGHILIASLDSPLLSFLRIDLSVHRTRLMKESHDQLLQFCSSIDKDFLNMHVPPAVLPKRKKGDFPAHLDCWFPTGLVRYQGEVQSHGEVQQETEVI